MGFILVCQTYFLLNSALFLFPFCRLLTVNFQHRYSPPVIIVNVFCYGVYNYVHQHK